METISVDQSGKLSFRGNTYRCALGRCGVRAEKHEGDGATPAGRFSLRRVFYRPDKFDLPPRTGLPISAIGKSDGWSDDTSQAEYNTYVTLPYKGSHEKLWRDDDLYDVVIVVGYNDDPPVLDKGSAIFIHIARAGYTPTDGCIALSQGDIFEILEGCDSSTQICIGG